MKTATQIHDDIIERFQTRIGQDIEPGSAIDLFTTVISEIDEDLYEEIDRNRTPHVWSYLEGQQLDDTGTMVNLPRKTGESDGNYKYRLMRWTLSNEAANASAINDALLLPVYASNIMYQPLVKGAGTAVVHVIPRDYTEETITNALEEAKSIVERVGDPATYVEYIVPRVLGVRFQIFMTVTGGDVQYIRNILTSLILEYVNNIAPYNYLQIGVINRIGINTQYVDYFSVLSVMIDDQVVDDIRILQNLDTKFLFDDITWTGDAT